MTPKTADTIVTYAERNSQDRDLGTICCFLGESAIEAHAYNENGVMFLVLRGYDTPNFASKARYHARDFFRSPEMVSKGHGTVGGERCEQRVFRERP